MATYIDAAEGKHNSGEINTPAFFRGDHVLASPMDGDFDYEFYGTVIGVRHGLWQVEDQEGNVFECATEQLTLEDED